MTSGASKFICSLVFRTCIPGVLALLVACHPTRHEEANAREFIKGVYGNPAALLREGYRFDSLGMNAVFVRSASLNREFYDIAKEQGCKVFVEFPTLNGKEYLQDHPDAWPINEAGEPSPPADWFMGICPTHSGFKEYRMNQLKGILAEYEVDGIFLDYFHLHAQFETPDPILPETCFCNRCTTGFSNYTSKEVGGTTISEKATWILENADSEWRVWRSHVLTTWATEIGTVLKDHQPESLLGIYYCPWYPNDFDGALYRILGIDVEALAVRADVLSPMLYHKMMDRPTAWVSEYVGWLDELTHASINRKPGIWPIVQAHNKPGVITAEEFREVMVNGSRLPSSGIMMFSEQSLLEDPEKVEVMRTLYIEDIR